MKILKNRHMKALILLLFANCVITFNAVTQNNADIERAALDYVGGLYYGDTLKIKRSVHKDLSKLALLRSKDGSDAFRENVMTYAKALDYSRDILIYPEYAAPIDAPKEIEILDVQSKIAIVKFNRNT